jgi:hypothetical protein
VLKDKIRKKLIFLKKDMSQPNLYCQTCDPSRSVSCDETWISPLKENQEKNHEIQCPTNSMLMQEFEKKNQTTKSIKK